MNNKGVIITLIIVLILIGIGLAVFMANLLGGNFRFSFGKVSDELIIDEVVEGNFRNINISTDMSEVSIKVSSDDTFRVTVYGDEDKTTFDKNNDKISIESKAKKCFGFCFNQKSSQVIVYVPENYSGEIDVTNNFGDIEIGRFNDAKMIIESKAGDVEVEGGYEIDVNNDYGDIDIDYARTLKAKAACGNIEVGEVQYLEVKNDYGNIKVDKVTNSLSIDEACGDVKIGSIDLKNNSRIKNNLGNIEIGSTNEIYIDAKVDLGDIKINNNYREASVELKLENDCGDIKINN